MRGVPLRIEIGPKDVARGQIALARRDKPGKEGKSFLPREGMRANIAAVLDSIHASLYERALAFRQANTHDPQNIDEFREVIQNGWAFSWWCGDAECEARIKEETKASTRCIPLDQERGQGTCIVCGKPASERAIFGRAY